LLDSVIKFLPGNNLKKSLLLLPFIIFSIQFVTFAQGLPHRMTPEEQQLWKSYIPPVNPLYTDPPAGPVRTMAEWEELQGIMITWTSYSSILRQVADYAQEEGLVYIVCSDSNSVKNYLISGGVPLINLKFLITSYNSVWCRDYGPWTVYKDDVDSLKIIDWIYNRPRPLDDVIPVFFANYIDVPIHQTTVPPYDLIATGGNFMTDGHGTGFSSKLILNENPSKTEAEIDTIMNLYMGLNRYIKMNTLPYDGIHHIDMHMKLLDEETLLVGQYPEGVADGPQIETNLQYILDNFKTCYGRDFKVVRILMPPDAYGRYPDQGGDYRTYTNSIIINKTVIIPTYEYQYDTTAFRIYREAMPGYNIVGINSNAIIPALGAIHCITKEVGVFNPVWISHPKIDGIVTEAGSYEIDAVIKSAAGISNADVYWTTDTTSAYSAIPMTEISPDSFIAFIPEQGNGTEVFYYLNASSNDGRNVSKPLTAPAGYYHFKVDVPVPVELVSFNAVFDENAVTLNWVTSSETNNKGFEIQKQNSEFSGQPTEWEMIGFVEGKGTTIEEYSYSFRDRDFHNGISYYRIKQTDFDGTFKIYGPVEVNTGSINTFSLEQNYPNPFNPTTSIKYSIGKTQYVTLKVYDVLGNEAAILVNEEKPSGTYKVKFDGKNLSSGIYFYRLSAGSFNLIRKMILIK
jgi:agmatine deiminase